MKLRIKGNSLRFRLSRSEVEAFGKTGKVAETVNFGPTEQDGFCYAIEKTTGNEISASFVAGNMTVSVPEGLANRWVGSDEVGIEGSEKLDDQTELHILIEKDFVCRTAPEHEDQSDNYPHPKGERSC